jgi:nucleotide-binding universal stress UspA family protein
LDGGQNAAHLGQEVARVVDEETPGVTPPALLDASVDVRSLRRGFDAEPLALVALAVARRSQMNDGVVAGELRGVRGRELAVEVRLGTRPVRGAVDGAAIAEDDVEIRPIVEHRLQLALHVKNGALRGALGVIAALSWKPAAEDNARRFARKPHVCAECAARHFEGCGLASAGPAGDDDSLHRPRHCAADVPSPARLSQAKVPAMNRATPSARFVVLAAVADSPNEREVVRVGANFARAIAGGELHLVSVVEDMTPPPALVPAPLGLGLTTAEILAAARKRLDAVASDARGQFEGRIVEHLAAGSAWKQILQVAIDLQADVLLVGTHGRTGVKRMVLGSVAEAVVRRASCPVIVVRPKDYHAFVPPEIEPACPDCLHTQRETNGERLWCDQHRGGDERRGHIHYEMNA